MTTTRPTPGSRFSLIPLDAGDTRRADALCGYCGQRVGLRTDLTATPDGRWAHTPCHDTLGPVVAARLNPTA
jgi:hypothetical protein